MCRGSPRPRSNGSCRSGDRNGNRLLPASCLALRAVGQQPVAHGGDLVLRSEVGGGLGGAEGGGDARGLGALGPPDLPRGQRGLLGEGDLDGVARGQGVEEAVERGGGSRPRPPPAGRVVVRSCRA